MLCLQKAVNKICVMNSKYYKSEKKPEFIYSSVFSFQIPSAMLRAILCHMRLTDPAELEEKCSAGLQQQNRGPAANRSKGRRSCSPQDDGTCMDEGGGGRHFYLPLTEERIDFLVGLSDQVVKVV